jgi:hypothetical protein
MGLEAALMLTSGGTSSAGVQFVNVTRWGRPGLQNGDWVMRGGNTWSAYLRSGKWEPSSWLWSGGNEFAAKATGATYRVLKEHVGAPYGEGALLNAIKFLLGQRRISSCGL